MIEALRQSYGEKAAVDRADGFVARYIYRPLSFYLTVPFAWMGCSANQVTIVRAALAVVSAALVAMPGRWSVVLGSSFYALCIMLDYVDGNLARMYATCGYFGAILEEVADHLGPSLFPFAVSIGLYLKPDRVLAGVGLAHSPWILVCGAMASIVYCLAVMALVYIKLIALNVPATVPEAACGPISREQTGHPLLRLGRRAINEILYLSVVFGVVLAASLNVMSLYLAARAVRNLALFAHWGRELASRLARLQEITRDR
jgi:phosphatidylglycerophosphate synthase